MLVVWIQKESFCEVSYGARVLPTAVAHHSPPHPGFLEGGVQRNSPVAGDHVRTNKRNTKSCFGLYLAPSNIRTSPADVDVLKASVLNTYSFWHSPCAVLLCLIESFHVMCGRGPIVVHPGARIVECERARVTSECLVVLLDLKT